MFELFLENVSLSFKTGIAQYDFIGSHVIEPTFLKLDS